MGRRFSIYKGLQKPLVYRGFKGKFIGWGIGSLIAGIVSGGLIGALTSMYFGGFITIVIISAGLCYTFHKQKTGLHDKTKAKGIYIHSVNLKKNYAELIS